jgi:hypothetical protein
VYDGEILVMPIICEYSQYRNKLYRLTDQKFNDVEKLGWTYIWQNQSYNIINKASEIIKEMYNDIKK